LYIEANLLSVKFMTNFDLTPYYASFRIATKSIVCVRFSVYMTLISTNFFA